MSDPQDEKFDDILRSAVGKIATAIDSGDYLDSGDRAELRRISPDQPVTPALWKLLLDLDLEEHPGWLPQEERETAWATLAMGMAMTPGLQDFNTPLGEALAEAGWSELRFVRLMRASGDRRIEEIRRMAQYLSAKEQPADWTHVGHLLFSRGEELEDDHRQIARDYYTALHRQETDEAAE